MTRGALPEAEADGVNYPGTYVAGLYDRASTEIAGRVVENEDLVNVPNWLPMQFRVSDGVRGRLVRRVSGPTSSSTVSSSTCSTARSPGSCAWQDPSGRRTSMVQRRLVSMKDEHLAGPGDHVHGRELVRHSPGPLRSRWPRGQRRGQALPRPERPPPDRARPGRGQRRDDLPPGRDTPVPRADRPGGKDQAAARRHAGRCGADNWSASPASSPTSSLSASRKDSRRPSRRSSRSTRRGTERFPRAATRPGHRDRGRGLRGAWRGTWAPGAACGIASTSSWTAPTSGPRRSCTCTSSICCRPCRRTPSTSTSACRRGQHGEAYRSHIFWDEMFIFPFLNFQRPILASALLGYRHARLGAAEAAARAAGYEERAVPVAERLQRAGGDWEVHQPEVGALAARPLPQPAARQHRRRLQRLAALHGHRFHVVPALHRCRAAGRDRPLLGQHRDLRSGAGPLRDPWRHGPGRVSRGYPDSDEQGCATTPTRT